MRCKYVDSVGNTRTTTVSWKIFYAKCPKFNKVCGGSKAYLPAITICNLRLF